MTTKEALKEIRKVVEEAVDDRSNNKTARTALLKIIIILGKAE